MKKTFVVVVLLMSYSSFGQKQIDLNDCQTVNRIMNDTVVKNFLHSRIDRSDRCVFENLSSSMSLNIGCNSFDIDGINYKIFDSAEVASRAYLYQIRVVKIWVSKTKKGKYFVCLRMDGSQSGI